MREEDLNRAIEIKEFLSMLRNCKKQASENESSFFTFGSESHADVTYLPSIFTKHLMKSIDELILNFETEFKNL